MRDTPVADTKAPAPALDAAPRPFPVAVRAVLVLLSVALFWLALPPVGLAPLALIAMMPFLCALQGRSPREAFGTGLAFGYLSGAANAHWFLLVFPWYFAAVLWAIIAIFPAIFAAVFARVARRGFLHLAIVAPATWVALDWFRSEVWHLKFSWFTLGHALAGSEVLRQNADLAGVYGLTLFAFLTSLALERAVAYRRDGRAFVLVLVVIAANLAFMARGNRVVGFAPKDEPRSLRVIAVQEENTKNQLEPKRSLTIAAIASHGKPDVILWPEDSFVRDWARVPSLRAACEEIAHLASAAFVFGSMRDIPGEPMRVHNAAVVLDPTGHEVGEYWKRCPVQFVESAVVPGTEFPTFPIAGARAGLLICYDGTYPFVTRSLVQAGAEVLLIPTMDEADWGPIQHAHHALFYALRACEVRKPIVRAASSGVSFALDAWGREITSIPPFTPGAFGATVHPNDTKTPYTLGGWLLPVVAAVVALGGLALTFRTAT